MSSEDIGATIVASVFFISIFTAWTVEQIPRNKTLKDKNGEAK
jgi:hypothetical protein